MMRKKERGIQMEMIKWLQVSKFCVAVFGGSLLAALGFNLGSYFISCFLWA